MGVVICGRRQRSGPTAPHLVPLWSCPLDTSLLAGFHWTPSSCISSPSRLSFHKFRFMMFTIRSLCIYDDSPVPFYFFLLGLKPFCRNLSYVLTSTIGFVFSKYLSLLPKFHAKTCSPWSIPKLLFSHALEVSFLPIESHHSNASHTLYLNK